MGVNYKTSVMLNVFPEPSSIKLIIKFISCIRESEIFHLKTY